MMGFVLLEKVEDASKRNWKFHTMMGLGLEDTSKLKGTLQTMNLN